MANSIPSPPHLQSWGPVQTMARYVGRWWAIVRADRVTSAAQAEHRASHGLEAGVPFEPELDSDLLALQFDAQAMRFWGLFRPCVPTYLPTWAVNNN